MGTNSLGRPTLKEGERRDVVDRSCGAIAHISRDRERELSLNTFVCETDGGDSHQFVLPPWLRELVMPTLIMRTKL